MQEEPDKHHICKKNRMKKLIALLILAIPFAVKAEINGVDTLTVKTEITCDHCLECETCGQNLIPSIYNLKGIKKITIEPEKNTITVVYQSAKITPNEIRVAISKRGYKADDIQADPQGLAKLDGCCKK